MSAERKAEELYPRAPRYVIDFGDNQVVRFAQMPQGSKPMHTRIVNLSESGMAFLVPYMSAPEEGEKIKVEFTAPNTDSIACFALVRRVETHRAYHADREPQTFKLIAVEFEAMHPRQRQLLNQGLTEQFRKKHQEYKRQQLFLKLKWSVKRILKNWGFKKPYDSPSQQSSPVQHPSSMLEHDKDKSSEN